MYDVLLISYGANGRLSPLFSYFIYFSQDQMCVSVRVYMCVLGQARAFMFYIGVSWHTRVVCRADKFASKMHHLYPLTLKPRSAPPLSLYLYLQRSQSRSTAQGVPPVVASGGLGHVTVSNNKTQLIQCTNMLVIVDFGGTAMSYLCARSKARELKALHSQLGML